MLTKITKACMQHMAIVKGKLINNNANNTLEIAKFLNIGVKKSQQQEISSNSDLKIDSKVHSKSVNPKKLDNYGNKSPNSDEKEVPKPKTSMDLSVETLIQKRYMMFLQNNELATIPVQLFHRKNKQLKILDFTKSCVSKCQKLTKQLQQGIRNFLLYCLWIFRQKNKIIINPSQFTDYFIVINQLFLLVQLDQSFLTEYINMLVHQSNLIKHIGVYIYLQNYRICLDSIVKIFLEKEKQGKKNLKLLFFVMRLISVIPIKNLYYQKSTEIIIFMQKQIRNSWQQEQFLQRSLISFEKLGFYNQKMVDKMLSILQKFNNNNWFRQKFAILNILLDVGKITNSNYKKHQKVLIQVLEIICDKKEQLIPRIGFKMLMGSIWIEQYWYKFFQYMDNHFVDANFHLIYALNKIFQLKKQEIPSMIYQRGRQTIKTILLNQRDVSKQKILADYHNKQTMSLSLSCQNQIANMLRLVNLGSVRTECIIDIFSVDILVNNQFVIEINGGQHYMLNLDTNNYQPNLKTRFRTQYLKRIGYKVINIDLSQYNEGSFQIIKMVYEIILKEGGNKQAKNFQLPLIASNDYYKY